MLKKSQTREMALKTGLEKLDKILNGGFPEKSSILVEGAPGVGKSTLGYNFLYQGLKSDEIAFIVYANRSNEEILTEFKSRGIDLVAEKLEEKIFWIDTTGMSRGANVLPCSLSELFTISNVLKEFLERQKDKKMRGLIEIVSPALMTNEPVAVYKFLSKLMQNLKRYDATVLFLIEQGMHNPEDVTSIEGLCDGMIEMRLRGEGQELGRAFRIKKMRGLKTELKWISVEGDEEIEAGEEKEEEMGISKETIMGRTLGHVQFVEKDGKPIAIIEANEVELPPDSSFKLLKRKDGTTSIIGRGGKPVRIALGLEKTKESGETITIKELTSGSGEKKPDEKSEFKDEGPSPLLRERDDRSLIPEKDGLTEVKQSLGSTIEEMKDAKSDDKGLNIKEREKEWEEEGKMGEKREGSLLKQAGLIDLKKEFQPAEEEEEEEVVEEEEEERVGILKRLIMWITGEEWGEEADTDKLKRLTLENLERVRASIKDERRAIIGIAYVLKGFLQVRFGINKEMTYMRLLKELESKEMKEDIRKSILDFYKRLTIEEYATGLSGWRLEEVYNMARWVVEELSE